MDNRGWYWFWRYQATQQEIKGSTKWHQRLKARVHGMVHWKYDLWLGHCGTCGYYLNYTTGEHGDRIHCPRCSGSGHNELTI